MNEVGHGDDIDTLPLVHDARKNLYGEVQFRYVVKRVLQMPVAANFWMDLGRVLFADGEINAKEQAWLDTFLSSVDVTDRSFLRAFSRKYVPPSEHREACLKALGLSPTATEDEIKTAFDLQIKTINDEMVDLPNHAQLLMEKRSTAIQLAYSYLQDFFNVEGLNFQTSNGLVVRFHHQKRIDCVCWNCKSEMLITNETKDLMNFRCNQCHALAGLTTA